MSEELTIIISVSDQASVPMRKVGESAKELVGVLGTALKFGALGAAAGIQAVGSALADSMGEAAQAEQAEARLAAILRATGGAAGMTKDQLLKLASGFQETTRFSDEMVMGAEGVLLRFREIHKDVLPRTLGLTLDLAEAMGTDATSAATMLGRALADPGEGLLRLKEAGISFSDAQIKQIQAMKTHGDVAGAQKRILDELTKSIGGTAAAMGDTWAGKMTILRNKFSDVLEIIGGAFLPAGKELITFINTSVLPAFKQWAETWAPVVQQAMKDLGTAIKTGDWSKFGEDLKKIGDAFWAWLTGKGGVLDQIGTQMNKFADALGAWAASPEGKAQIQDATTMMGNALLDGLKISLETSAKLLEAMNALVEKLGEWVKSPEGEAAITNLIEAIRDGLQATINQKFQSIDWGQLIVELMRQSFNVSLPGMILGDAELLAALFRAGDDIIAGIIGGINADAGKFYKALSNFIWDGVDFAINDVKKRVESVFGGNWMGALFGSSETSARQILGGLGFHQFGGRMAAGELGIVGEAGPELFIPDRSGMIIPNGRFGGAPIILNFAYSPAISFASQREARAIIAPLVVQAMLEARSRQVGATG